MRMQKKKKKKDLTSQLCCPLGWQTLSWFQSWLRERNFCGPVEEESLVLCEPMGAVPGDGVTAGEQSRWLMV